MPPRATPIERALSRDAAARNRLLRALPSEDLSVLKASFDLVVLERGQVLGRPAELMDRVYFPLSGLVSVLAVLADGRSVETAMIGCDGGVGLLPAIGDRKSKSLLRVQIEGEALVVSGDAFAAVAHQSPAVRSLIARHTEMMHGQTVQSAACNALCSAETRIARWLLMCRDRIQTDSILLTQDELAETLGLQRTTVTAAARALQAKNLIEYRRGSIRLLTRAGLIAAAAGCYQSDEGAATV